MHELSAPVRWHRPGAGGTILHPRIKDVAPIHGETSHIAFDELHTAPYLRRQDLELVASDHEHVVRSIEPDDFESRRRHRDEDPAERASST